jgi:tRNA-Thr(GGU) m(6)t(6)A37 methyltransferase TsaA
MDDARRPEPVTYRPVGFVRSPFQDLAGMPLQSVAADDVRGEIVIYDEFAAGLADLDGFSHVFVVSHLHRAVPGGLRVMPFLDDSERGVFATRSPRHPNPIGLSVMRLVSASGAVLQVTGVDLVDATPVLDLKPYVPQFDAIAAERTGWLSDAAARVHDVRSDARFRDR